MAWAMAAGAACPCGSCCRRVLPGGPRRGYGARSTQARLTPYGQESPVGRLDADTARNDKSWAELPSLADFQNIGTLRPGAVVLLEAVVGAAFAIRCW